MNKVKLALLGCGDVAQRDYLPEFHRISDRAELVSVCGRSPERARTTAQQYGIRDWYTDYQKMLAETEAEAVINLTPIQLHVETNIAALQAGKHVYSEKPIAGSLHEAQHIRDLAEQHKRKLVCAPCVFLFPQTRYAQSRLAELGKIHLARGYAIGGVPPWSGYTSDPSQFFSRGSGPAFDVGVYPLHALTGLLGPVKRVTAMTAQAQHSFVALDGPAQGKTIPIESPDNWQLLLDFGNERLATVDANYCAQATRMPQVEVMGLTGTIAFNWLDVAAPVEMLVSGSEWETIQLPRTGRESGPDHLLGVEHLVDCIQQDTTPILSVAHALHVVEVIEKAALSAKEGRTYNLETTF